MASLFGSGITLLFFIFIIILIFLYVISIIWCVNDARARGGNTKLSFVLSIVPFAGILAHILVRPPLLLIDKKEQELDIALKQRQLKAYGNCSKCGAEVKDDFIVCPSCGYKLRDKCLKCDKPLDFNWSLCPYCGSVKYDSSFKSSNSTKDSSRSAKHSDTKSTKETTDK